MNGIELSAEHDCTILVLNLAQRMLKVPSDTVEHCRNTKKLKLKFTERKSHNLVRLFNNQLGESVGTVGLIYIFFGYGTWE